MSHGKHRVTSEPRLPRGRHRASRSGRLTGAVVAASAVAGSVAAVVASAQGADASTQEIPMVNWDRVAQCESGGNWHTNTGNGYYGGLQFSLPTWRSNGGHGMPNHNSRGQQIAVANKVLHTQGIHAWPVCGKRGIVR